MKRPITTPIAIILTIVGSLCLVASGQESQRAPLPAGTPGSPLTPDTRSDGRIKVTRFGFEINETDRNFDRWPDGWNRRIDKGFPAYTEIELTPYSLLSQTSTEPGRFGKRPRKIEPPAAPPIDLGQQGVRMRLDGGAVELISPPIIVNSNISYALEAWTLLRPSEWGEHNEAWITLTFSSRDGQIQQSHRSEAIKTQGVWTKIELEPFVPSDSEIAFLTISLNVHPTRAEDLYGEAWFDELRLIHMPKLAAMTNQPFNLFTSPGDVEVACSVSGIDTTQSTLNFELRDVRNATLAARDLALVFDGLRMVPRSVTMALPEEASAGEAEANESDSTEQETPVDEQPTLDQTIRLGNDLSRDIGGREWIRWRPPIDDFGYYTVHITLTDTQGIVISRELSLVVMPPIDRAPATCFGWNVPRQSESTSLQNLTELFRNSGLRWVMYPVWYGPDESQEGQRVGELAERLTLDRMEMIALLDTPPASLRGEFGSVEQGIVGAVRDKDIWRPAIEHVLTRLSFKINWWQLGSPSDRGFVGHANVDRKIKEIKDHLQRFGKNIHVGLSWNWLHESPAVDSTPVNVAATAPNNANVPVSLAAESNESKLPNWDYLLYGTRATMTAEEFERYLASRSANEETLWTTLQPLDSRRYSTTTRIRDLIERMLVGVVHDAEVVLVPDPFSDRSGILNADMSPTELLLPWRTTAYMLAEARSMGSLILPRASQNRLFQREDDLMMVVWNDRPVVEPLTLGDDLVVVDVWGKTTPLETVDGVAMLQVGPEPQFLVGIDSRLARWQMSTNFDLALLESEVGRPQRIGLFFENSMTEGVSGTVTLSHPELWDSPQELGFKAATGERIKLEFPVVMRPSVITGRQPIAITFDIQGHQRYRLRTERELNIGIENIELETSIQRDEVNNRLIFNATLVNATDKPVSFDLYLFAPDRKRQRAFMTQAEPGRTKRTFVLQDADAIGSRPIWLRAEEVRGSRVLNQRLDATRSGG